MTRFRRSLGGDGKKKRGYGNKDDGGKVSRTERSSGASTKEQRRTKEVPRERGERMREREGSEQEGENEEERL